MAKTKEQKLQSIMKRVTRNFNPDDILYELSLIYEGKSVEGDTEAEVEFWLKCSRACTNLSSGMEKWFDEAIDEEREEEGEEE